MTEGVSTKSLIAVDLRITLWAKIWWPVMARSDGHMIHIWHLSVFFSGERSNCLHEIWYKRLIIAIIRQYYIFVTSSYVV